MFEVSTEPGTPGIVRPRRGRGADLVTIVLSAWLLVGVFVDGWAHNSVFGNGHEQSTILCTPAANTCPFADLTSSAASPALVSRRAW